MSRVAEKKCASSLFDLLRLELDSLSVDEDTLALVRLGASPFSDLGRELGHNPLVDTLQQDSSRLRCARNNTLGDTQFNWVGKADLERNELLAGVVGLDGGRLLLDGSPVTDTNHTQNTDVAFGDTEDVILEERANGSWIEKQTVRQCLAVTGPPRRKVRRTYPT